MKGSFILFVSHFFLAVVAVVLFLVFAPVGFVWSLGSFIFKGKFKDVFFRLQRYMLMIAITVDQSGNTVCPELFNDLLIKKDTWCRFGNPDETISSVLGKNKERNSLTKLGKWLSWLLDKIDPNHVIKSIEADEM